MKVEVTELFMEFYRPMKILKKRFNDTFLVLIPKKNGMIMI